MTVAAETTRSAEWGHWGIAMTLPFTATARNTDMTNTVVEAWNFNDADELLMALNQAVMLAKEEGHTANTVYAENKRRMTLVRERLSDGSHVMNLYFFDGEE